VVAWQKRARLATLVVGVGIVAAVFATSRRREGPPPATPVNDPEGVFERVGAWLKGLFGG